MHPVHIHQKHRISPKLKNIIFQKQSFSVSLDQHEVSQKGNTPNYAPFYDSSFWQMDPPKVQIDCKYTNIGEKQPSLFS